MIESENPHENSTIVESTSITLATPITISNPKSEDDAKKSLKKIAANHKKFYRRLSYEATNTATNVNDNRSKIVISAKTSACIDKKNASLSVQENTENMLTVKTLSNSVDLLNEPLPSSSSAKSSQPASLLSGAEELNDSERVTDDVESTSVKRNNVMRVLNSPTDVSHRLLIDSESQPQSTVQAAAAASAGVSMKTESYQGCRYLEAAESETMIRDRCRRRRSMGSKPPPVVTADNLIGKAIDVSKTDDYGSDFPTHTTMDVSFGSAVDSIYRGGATDANNDERDTANTNTTKCSTPMIATTTVHSHSESLLLSAASLPPPVNNNHNKWTSTDDSKVSCHSTFETSTSSSLSSLSEQSSQSRSCLSFESTVHSPLSLLSSSKSSSLVARRSLVEQRKHDLFERSQEDTRARSRSRSPAAEDLQRNSASFPSVNRLVKMYTKLLQDNKQPANNTTVTVNLAEDLEKKMSLKEEEDHLKPSIDPHRNSPLSDEGCNLGQSPYSSDCEEETETVNPPKKKKEQVARSASSDSALGLDEDPIEPPTSLNQGRRMTLTVTDLPLRPALLPLAEPTNLPDSPTAEVQISLNALLTQTAIPSKVLLKERVVEIPEDRFGSLSSSRRESAQSCISDYQPSECGGVRFVRTPSVVVSDYSDDLMCGITLEEIEYFRAQRLRRRSSVDTAGTEKDDAASDVSAASSCSNLYYCGSTISALDGAECYVNGTRMPIHRKTSDCSTCDGSGDEDSQTFVIPEQPEDLKEYISYCTDQMLAQQQQQQQQMSRKPKKVGGTILNTNTDTFNTKSYCSEP